MALGVWTGYNAWYVRPLLALDGTDTVISGIVSDRCHYEGNTTRYTIVAKCGGRYASVYWYTNTAESATVSQIGDRVTVEAVMTALDSDYAAGQNVFLSLRSATLLQTERTSLYGIKRAVRSYRDVCTARIRQHMPQETASLLLAILFGDDRGLSEEYASALYQTGIGHITSVSGLHLVFFCTALTWVLQRLRVSVKGVFVGNIAAALLFSVMVDSAISIRRAAVMLLLSLAAPLFGRRKDAVRSLCVAMLLCTLPAPYAIGSASFWLSVSGVFGLTVLAPFMQERRGKIPQGIKGLWKRFLNKLSPMVWVWVGVMPASILLCGETSLLSPIANLVLIPFCTAALGLGLLSVCLGEIGIILLPFANGLCRLVLWAAKLLAGLPHSYVTVSDASTKWLLALLLIGIFLLALRCYGNRRVLQTAIFAAGAVLLLQMSYLHYAHDAQLRVAVLGEVGELALVCTADDTVIVADCSGDAGNGACVADYLAAQGIRRVDMLLLPTVKNAASYHQALEGVAVGQVVLVNGKGWRDGTAICGNEPFCVSSESLQLEIGALRLELKEKECLLQWNGMTVLALPADIACTGKYTAVIRYDGMPQTTDRCDIAICTEEESAADYGQNTLLSFTDARNCLVESLSQ